MVIRVKSIREPPGAGDGYRVLIARSWPRGLRREQAAIDLWPRQLAASARVRRRAGSPSTQWHCFRHLYASELDARGQDWRPLLTRAARHCVTLLHAGSDEACNDAVALMEYLDAYLQSRRSG